VHHYGGDNNNNNINTQRSLKDLAAYYASTQWNNVVGSLLLDCGYGGCNKRISFDESLMFRFGSPNCNAGGDRILALEKESFTAQELIDKMGYVYFGQQNQFLIFPLGSKNGSSKKKNPNNTSPPTFTNARYVNEDDNTISDVHCFTWAWEKKNKNGKLDHWAPCMFMSIYEVTRREAPRLKKFGPQVFDLEELPFCPPL